MLAFSVGGWGVHKFYLRQTELGLFYIFLNIFIPFKLLGFGVATFLAWYDAFKFLMMDDQEFDKKYNNIHFRDRYGKKREQTPDQRERRGKYILLDEDEFTTQKTGGYFEKFQKSKVAKTFKQSGIKKLKDFDTKGAIEDFKKALESDNEDMATHYNLACAYSLNENAIEAYKHLDLAIQNGFKEGAKIQNQEELAYIRVLPIYDKFKANRFRLTQEMVDELKQREFNLLENIKKEKERQETQPKASYSILFQEYLKDENK